MAANDNQALGFSYMGFVFKPNIAKVGEAKRGAIVFGSQKATAMGDHFSVNSMRPPSLESFRLATFFFDLIDAVEFHGPHTALFPSYGTEGFGITHKTTVSVQGEDLTEISDIPFVLLMAHEHSEKGMWTIWHEDDFEPIPDRYRVPDKAFKLHIQNALLVPHREVPFEEVLQFKQQRQSELLKLHHHLEELCRKIAHNPHDAEMFRLEVEKFDLSVTDYLKVIKERNWKKSLADLDVRMDWITAVGASLAGINMHHPLPLSSNLIGALTGLVSGLKIESIIGSGSAKKMESPFAYLGRIVTDL